jgi:ADP-heptose:LPS heptosyltransferase
MTRRAWPSLEEDAVLVIRPSSLGDIVHALALVADVRTHRPELAIDWVAEEVLCRSSHSIPMCGG